MPIARVQMPDGRIARIEVPEGTTPEQAERMAQGVVPQSTGLADAIRNTTAGISQNARNPQPDARPASFWQGVGEGAVPYAANSQRVMEYMNPLVWASRAGLDKATGQDTSPAGKVREANRLAAASPYKGSTVGKIGGAILGSLPTMAIRNPVLQGAAAGAMGTESPGDIKQLALNTGVGAAGGWLGSKVSSLLGRAVAGNTNPAVRKLAEEGVTMTPGQRGGANSVSNFIEDKVMGSVWPLSAVADAAKNRANNGLRLAAANRVLKPIGETMPKRAQIGPEAIGEIQDKVHGAYDKALSNLILDLDTELVDDLTRIHGDTVRVAGTQGAEQVGANINRVVDRVQQGALSGQPLRETISELRAVASKNAGSGVGDQLWAIDDALANAIERQNGGQALDAYTSARTSEALLRRLEDAAARPGPKDGNWGAAQLKQAVERRGYGTTTAKVARGEAAMQDLSDAASSVMRNGTANSGTPGRALAIGSVVDPLAALTIYANPKTAIPIGGSMLRYIPGVDEILQRLAINRPQVLQQAGAAIQGASPYVGLLGAPVAASTIPPLLGGR